MDSVYKWFSDAWLTLDGKLSFIKPLWLRITLVVVAAMIALQLLSSLIPLVFCFAIVAVGVVFLFKALHETDGTEDPVVREDADTSPDK
jgi:hypothetical protein